MDHFPSLVPGAIHQILLALLMALGMFWKVAWSLILGFAVSAALQATASRERIATLLGRNGFREIAIATGAGIASSSCSYASASISRTLFRKGAGLVPSLAFLLASTNLVIELGIVLYLLLGWEFMLGEWSGGLVLIGLMALIVALTYPKRLVAEARHHGSDEDARHGCHKHGNQDRGILPQSSQSPTAVLLDPNTWHAIARNFTMDWQMLWKDLALGFLIAGALAVFVPDIVWQSVFLRGASPWVQLPANAVLGPIVGVLSFVCSIGNVPMAAVLWGAGISFGGVLAFLYSDLIVIPLLDVYRRYYGWKMAAYIATVFYIVMVAAAIIIDLIFTLLGWVPHRHAAMAHEANPFVLDYTFWLNLIFGIFAVVLFWIARHQPVQHSGSAHQSGHHAVPQHHMTEPDRIPDDRF